MAAGKYRAQILLEPEQHQTLVSIAESQNRSLSDLIRHIVDQWLANKAEAWIWEERIKSVEQLKAIREQAEKNYGVYDGDLIAESRDERNDDLDHLWQGEA